MIATIMASKDVPERHLDIFIDVFNPDYRYCGGIHPVLDVINHTNILIEVISIAVFICKRQCVMPPTFVLECPIVCEAIKKTSPFFENEVVVWPIRDEGPKEMWEKKQEEYKTVLEDYPHLESRDGLALLLGPNGRAIRPRVSQVGAGIASQWREGSDVAGPWNKVKGILESQTIEKLRGIPDLLIGKGVAVTAPAIVANMENGGKIKKYIDYLLQNAYGNVYIKEFGLTTLKNLPFFQNSFGLSSSDPFYDCHVLKDALTPVGLWPIHRALTPEEILLLRSREGHFSFMDAYMKVTAHDHNNVRRRFSVAVSEVEGKGTVIPHQFPISQSFFSAGQLTRAKINKLSDFLKEVSLVVIRNIEQDIGLHGNAVVFDNNKIGNNDASDKATGLVYSKFESLIAELNFTPREIQMINALMEAAANSEGFVSLNTLEKKFTNGDTIRTTIHRINKKALERAGIGDFITNKRGSGYKITQNLKI